MDLGPAELIIVLLIALLLFGGAKLPKLARSIGEASREFKKGVDGHKDDVPAPAPPAPAAIASVETPAITAPPVATAPVATPSAEDPPIPPA